jgi:hypothetical protein
MGVKCSLLQVFKDKVIMKLFEPWKEDVGSLEYYTTGNLQTYTDHLVFLA